MLLLAYVDKVIDDDEFVRLFDVNKSKYPEFPYWTYTQFDIDKLEDDECRAEFTFLKIDIYELSDVLDLPDEIITDNRQNEDILEALCILLKRFVYPCRYGD